jgi:hypothetical protein
MLDGMARFLCRVHVIVKYMSHNKKEEHFFPVMFISFWLNIVCQSIFFLTYIYVCGRECIPDELPKSVTITIVSFFFLTEWSMSLVIRDESRYEEAEEWFLSKPKKEQKIIMRVTFIFMTTTFLALLIWALSNF